MSPLERLLVRDCECTNYCQITPFDLNIITKISMNEVIIIFISIKYICYIKYHIYVLYVIYQI